MNKSKLEFGKTMGEEVELACVGASGKKADETLELRDSISTEILVQ